jgi:hypothetical protein
VDAGDDRRIGSDAGLEIILRLPVIAIGQIVGAKIQLNGVIQLPSDSEVQYRETRRYDGWIIAIQSVVVDGPDAQEPLHPCHARTVNAALATK